MDELSSIEVVSRTASRSGYSAEEQLAAVHIHLVRTGCDASFKARYQRLQSAGSEMPQWQEYLGIARLLSSDAGYRAAMEGKYEALFG